MDIEDVLFCFFICTIVLLGFLLAVIVPRAIYVESKCLEHGYPEAGMTFALEGYCIKLISDGESISVPLNEVINGSKENMNDQEDA